MVTGAWAGASLAPAGHKATAAAAAAHAPLPAAPDGGWAADPAALPDGYVLAGAAKTSIEPQPAKYGGTWQKDHDLCATLSESSFSHGQEFAEHLATAGSPWPENPDCIYMGGFGIGPMNPVSSWNQDLGLWVRALALRDKQGDDLVMAIIDGEGYFWDYAHK